MKITASLITVFCTVTYFCFSQSGLKEDVIHFVLKGKGSPVVVFESGLGDSSEGWSQIQDSLSKITSTISYDRLGLGKSSATENPRTLDNLVNELNSLLEDTKMQEPYILVGHSMGGFIIRKFQQSYPDKVKGLVLVDPSHEKLMESILATKPKEEAAMMTNGINGFYAN